MPAAPDDLARHESAATFLQNLPGPWACGPVCAHRLAPLLLERADATGWQLGAGLRSHLAARPRGIRDHGAVLAARIRDLAAPRHPSTPAPRPVCASCGSSSSLIHGARPAGPLCVPCATRQEEPPAADPAARKAELLALIHRRPDSCRQRAAS